MLIRIERVEEAAATARYLAPIAAVIVTVALSCGIFALLGFDAGRAANAFFLAPLKSANSLAEIGVKGGPLIMIAVGLAMAFRAGLSNIGAEGQLIMGAIAAGGVALAGGDAPGAGIWILPLMGLAGILGGMAWAAIPAFLKLRFEVSEILSSLMLTYIATLSLSMLVYGPWRDPEALNLPQSRMFSDSATLPILWTGTRLHLGFVVALAIALLDAALIRWSLLAFQIRVAGRSANAARHAGFSRSGIVWLVLLASGGLAGLAGMIEVAGPIGQLIPDITPGYGFTAIIVAFLGRLHPLGIIPAGLVVALSYIGGENAQVTVGLPQAATRVVQGLLLFSLLGADFVFKYRLRFDAVQRPVEAA